MLHVGLPRVFENSRTNPTDFFDRLRADLPSVFDLLPADLVNFFKQLPTDPNVISKQLGANPTAIRVRLGVDPKTVYEKFIADFVHNIEVSKKITVMHGEIKKLQRNVENEFGIFIASFEDSSLNIGGIFGKIAVECKKWKMSIINIMR